MLQRRLKPLSKQRRVMEDTLSNPDASILGGNSVESPRASEGGTGAVRKVTVKKQTFSEHKMAKSEAWKQHS